MDLQRLCKYLLESAWRAAVCGISIFLLTNFDKLLYTKKRNLLIAGIKVVFFADYLRFFANFGTVIHTYVGGHLYGRQDYCNFYAPYGREHDGS